MRSGSWFGGGAPDKIEGKGGSAILDKISRNLGLWLALLAGFGGGGGGDLA